jgi:phage-related protein
MVAPYIPLPENVDVSLGSEISSQARVLKAQFGNGYTQRAGDGQNAVSASYAVSFQNLTRPEAKVLLDFFNLQAGYKSFRYRVSGESVDRLWTCEQWSREHVSPMLDTVKATFVETFTS